MPRREIRKRTSVQKTAYCWTFFFFFKGLSIIGLIEGPQVGISKEVDFLRSLLMGFSAFRALS